MSDGSSIEWLAWPGYRPASWNPTRGCTRLSEGCRHCYAERMAARFSRPGQWGHGIAEMRGGDHRTRATSGAFTNVSASTAPAACSTGGRMTRCRMWGGDE